MTLISFQRRFLRSAALASLVAAGSAQAADAPAGATNNFVLEAQTMDRSADPCTDFFRYANGLWLDTHPIPADRSRFTSYDEVSERNLAALKRIVEEATAAGKAPGPAAARVGAYYRSGMDEGRIEADGKQSLADEFARIDAITTRDQLFAEIARLHRLGASPLFSFSVNVDAKNTQRYIPQLGQGGLGLPDRDYYLKTDAKTRKIRQQYVEHVTRMFVLLGDAPDVARREADDVMAFETRLARASMDLVTQRDPQAVYHLLDLGKLDKSGGGARWNAYFDAVGLSAPGDFNVAQPVFFREAGRMISTVDLGHWKTYLRWQLIDATAPYLTNAFVDEDFDFHGRILSGTKELQPRWKRVLTTIDREIGEALGELYVAEYFTPDAKARALQMTGNIKKAMGEDIDALPWMSPETKREARKKLDKVVVKIGYPDTWRDYSALRIDDDSYVGNTLRANEFEFNRVLAKLGKPIDRSEWDMTPPTVNAYYNPTMNEMVFPAGVLQRPLFDVQADDAANYGNTGATIGHELTHGFDDEGHQYDGDGNLRSWWTPEDEKRFVARVGAIHRQFDAFIPIDKVHVNGKLTAGENIADLGGLKIALRALRMAQAGKGPAPLIDGMTPEQRFFVAYAQSFRSNIRPEKLRMELATDPHSPDKFRVVAPLANMPGFAEAFSCPANRSPLLPPDRRVEIW